MKKKLISGLECIAILLFLLFAVYNAYSISIQVDRLNDLDYKFFKDFYISYIIRDVSFLLSCAYIIYALLILVIYHLTDKVIDKKFSYLILAGLLVSILFWLAYFISSAYATFNQASLIKNLPNDRKTYIQDIISGLKYILEFLTLCGGCVLIAYFLRYIYKTDFSKSKEERLKIRQEQEAERKQKVIQDKQEKIEKLRSEIDSMNNN